MPVRSILCSVSCSAPSSGKPRLQNKKSRPAEIGCGDFGFVPHAQLLLSVKGGAERKAKKFSRLFGTWKTFLRPLTGDRYCATVPASGRDTLFPRPRRAGLSLTSTSPIPSGGIVKFMLDICPARLGQNQEESRLRRRAERPK